MKKLLLIATTLFVGFSAMAQQKADDVIKVKTEKIDFGKIKQSVPVTTYFEIKNVSDKPVVIETAYGSCGCTTPEVPKEPIAPNASIKLKVNYNAASGGAFTKDVFVKIAGIQEPKNLKITGEVLDPAAFASHAKEKKAPAAKAKG
jgi:activator of HSP90 ATPase